MHSLSHTNKKQNLHRPRNDNNQQAFNYLFVAILKLLHRFFYIDDNNSEQCTVRNAECPSRVGTTVIETVLSKPVYHCI